MITWQLVLGLVLGMVALAAVIARRNMARHMDSYLSQPFLLVRRPAEVLAARANSLRQSIDQRRERTRTWLFRGSAGLPLTVLALVLTPVWAYVVWGLWKMDTDVFEALGQGDHAKFIAAGVIAVTLLLGLLFWDAVGVWSVLPFHLTGRRARISALIAVALAFLLLIGVYHTQLATERAFLDHQTELAALDEKQAAAAQLEAAINEGQETKVADLTSRFAEQRDAAQRRYEFNKTGNKVQAWVLSGGEMLLSPAPFVALTALSLGLMTLVSVIIGWLQLAMRGVVYVTDRVYSLTRSTVLTLVRKDTEITEQSSVGSTPPSPPAATPAATQQGASSAPQPGAPVAPSAPSTASPVAWRPAPTAPTAPTAWSPPQPPGPAHGSASAPWDNAAGSTTWTPPTPTPAI
jgi:hypothetical protein